MAEGRSAGPGHRRVPRRAARAGRPRAAAQRGRSLPQRHPAAGARRGRADQAGGRRLPPGDRVARAQGDAHRFVASTTRSSRPRRHAKRLYLETMEQSCAARTRSSSIRRPAAAAWCPICPLPELERRARERAAGGPAASSRTPRRRKSSNEPQSLDRRGGGGGCGPGGVVGSNIAAEAFGRELLEELAIERGNLLFGGEGRDHGDVRGSGPALSPVSPTSSSLRPGV